MVVELVKRIKTEKLTKIGEFASSLAHNMRNQLIIITLNIVIIKDKNDNVKVVDM